MVASGVGEGGQLPRAALPSAAGSHGVTPVALLPPQRAGMLWPAAVLRGRVPSPSLPLNKPRPMTQHHYTAHNTTLHCTARTTLSSLLPGRVPPQARPASILSPALLVCAMCVEVLESPG